MGQARVRGSAPGVGVEQPATSPVEGVSFEEALERLESIVTRLEDGELALEAALTAFEEGVALARHCAGALDTAERRIDELVREGGREIERPLREGGDGE